MDAITVTFLVLLGTLVFIQILYLIITYSAPIRHFRKRKKGKIQQTINQPPLSVIVPVNDDAYHLKRNLPLILEQDYPVFEVIVINIGNNIECKEVLDELYAQYNNLYISFTPESARYVSRKKLALSIGIKASQYEWIVTTESFVAPLSKHWLSSLARNLTEATEVVLAPSIYDSTSSLRERAYSFESFVETLRFLGAAINKTPYRGTGENLLFKKELFARTQGFQSHLTLLEGGDDLFINEITNSKNTRVDFSQESLLLHTNLNTPRKAWEEKALHKLVSFRKLIGVEFKLFVTEQYLLLTLFVQAFIGFCYCLYAQLWLPLTIILLIMMIRFILLTVIINWTAKKIGLHNRFFFLLPIFDLAQPFRYLRRKISLLFRHREDFLRR